MLFQNLKFRRKKRFLETAYNFRFPLTLKLPYNRTLISSEVVDVIKKTFCKKKKKLLLSSLYQGVSKKNMIFSKGHVLKRDFIITHLIYFGPHIISKDSESQLHTILRICIILGVQRR